MLWVWGRSTVSGHQQIKISIDNLRFVVGFEIWILLSQNFFDYQSCYWSFLRNLTRFLALHCSFLRFMTSLQDELLCTYAALILHDDGAVPGLQPFAKLKTPRSFEQKDLKVEMFHPKRPNFRRASFRNWILFVWGTLRKISHWKTKRRARFHWDPIPKPLENPAISLKEITPQNMTNLIKADLGGPASLAWRASKTLWFGCVQSRRKVVLRLAANLRVRQPEIPQAAGCNVEGYWPLLMTKMISSATGMRWWLKHCSFSTCFINYLLV